jgi:plastocyanin
VLLACKLVTCFTNDSQAAHNVSLERGEQDVGATQTTTGSTTSETIDLRAGTHTFYCSIDGHRQAGMKGTLTFR